MTATDLPSKLAGMEIAATSMFAQRLVAEMERQGKSPEALADACGVRVITIERWSDGRTDPKVHLAGRAARALGVSLDWLAGMTDSRNGDSA